MLQDKCTTCDLRMRIPNTEIALDSTLLKYTEPYKVNPYFRKTDAKPKAPVAQTKSGSKLMTDHSPETQEVLDCIQRARFWMKDGEMWTQAVSPAITMRREIQELNEAFNAILWKRHARPMGVCPVRYDIVCQLFDELIRQVTVTSAERGLSLVRIRSELKYTIQTLFYMWRDVMEYFEPIVEKSVTVLAEMNDVQVKIKTEIENLQQALDALHWKIKLHEQEKAYERQATLDWFKHRKEQEEKLMKHLSVLGHIMTLDAGQLSTHSIANQSSKTKKKLSAKKKQRADEFGNYEAMKLSDILKDLVVNRKEAEEIINTKELLKDEIVWVKGEISKNKAYLDNLLKTKQVVKFGGWLENLVTGNDHEIEMETNLNDGVINAEKSRSLDQSAQSEEDLPSQTGTDMPLIEWLASRGDCQCPKVENSCRHQNCSQMDEELLLIRTIAGFLGIYKDKPRCMRFEHYHENYLKKKTVKDLPSRFKETRLIHLKIFWTFIKSEYRREIGKNVEVPKSA